MTETSRFIYGYAAGDEDRRLAPYASREGTSRGRRFPEPPPNYRGEYQRDRDRIVHCGAFRRLEYKTQVFVNHEGDMFRTRLTHSLEVAQIGRAIARVLGLNEDLTEAIALAHDLGHTPFGHAGQDALNACMAAYGGFEHNYQSLRVVDELEQRYAEFSGLNLTFETREGVLKHCSMQRAETLGDVAERFLRKQQPGLEAQLANIADEIAYNAHDVDDGLRAGLITIEQLAEVTYFRRHYDFVRNSYPTLPPRRVIHEVVRRMINNQVTDLIETARHNINQYQPSQVQDVRTAPGPLISFSAEMNEQNQQLKQFLRNNLYRHFRVRRMAAKAGRILSALFSAFLDDVHLLPPETRERLTLDGTAVDDTDRARAIADYIAGMTDRYAIKEYERLFNPSHLT